MTATTEQFISEISKGSRPWLARAITLTESTRIDHRNQAEEILSKLLPQTGKSIRLAISGPPGVGKSSFIETLGLLLTNAGKKVAVLAIDPSSPITGGSILGDKTRMEELAKSPTCFIRPSPSSGALGGVARHTRETILLCEAAGFEIILVETVGIGQSEIMAASMTDLFIQLHQPLSGDELQGIKKGVMELADLLIITKTDGETKTAAELAKNDLLRAISLTRTDEDTRPDVLLTSAHTGAGIADAWSTIGTLAKKRKDLGLFEKRRHSQTRQWLTQEIQNELEALLASHPAYESLLEKTYQNVDKSGEHCGRAARTLVQSLLKKS